MLDTLPVELIKDILSFPPTSSSSSASSTSALYIQRTQTLLALCLTNRRMRAVAQPLLFEVVKVDDEASLQGFRNALKHSSRVASFTVDGTMAASLSYSHDDEEEEEAFWEEAEGRRLPQVRSLGGTDTGLRAVLGLRPLSHLRILNLSGLTLGRIPTSFDSLVVLTVTRSSFERDYTARGAAGGLTYLHSFLSFLPSLRAFACTSFGRYIPPSPPSQVPDDVMEPIFWNGGGRNGGPALREMRGRPAATERDLRDVFPQLETLCCDIKMFGDDPFGDDDQEVERSLLHSSRLLVDVHVDDQHLWPRPLLIKHLRFHGPELEILENGSNTGMSPDFNEESLNRFLNNLLETTNLETVYLSLQFQHAADAFLSLHHPMSDILILCETRGVEVVFEPFERATFVSPHFWAKCKALKGKEDKEKKEEIEAKTEVVEA